MNPYLAYSTEKRKERRGGRETESPQAALARSVVRLFASPTNVRPASECDGRTDGRTDGRKIALGPIWESIRASTSVPPCAAHYGNPELAAPLSLLLLLVE